MVTVLIIVAAVWFAFAFVFVLALCWSARRKSLPMEYERDVQAMEEASDCAAQTDPALFIEPAMSRRRCRKYWRPNHAN